MKILFLDIDGVLNSRRTCIAFDSYPHNFDAANMALFDHVAIGLIQKLCSETGARIVLSSDWRHSFTAEECADALKLPIIDVTPKLPATRGFEINAWLSAHPEVQVFAIVDDIAEMFDVHMNNFVQTNDEFGLSLRDYLDLKRILSS